MLPQLHGVDRSESEVELWGDTGICERPQGAGVGQHFGVHACMHVSLQACRVLWEAAQTQRALHPATLTLPTTL